MDRKTAKTFRILSMLKRCKQENKFTFKLLNLIKKCREKGKHDLYGKIVKKYNIDTEKLEEAYYD